MDFKDDPIRELEAARDGVDSSFASSELAPADVPGPEASRSELVAFALSLNGYRAAGNIRRCGEISKLPSRNSIDELRVAMFMHLRACHHANMEIDDRDVHHLRSLADRIRELVVAKSRKFATEQRPDKE